MRNRFVLTLIIFLAGTAFSWAASDKFTLVIDAGHGGHDAGALGAFSKEKDINLRTALAFGEYVERNCPDVRVIYTRKKDFFVPLHTRAEIANKAKADLFISIHTNSLPNKKIARGFETYTLGMHRASENLDVAKRENSVILVEKDYKQHYEGFDPNSSESYIIFEFLQDHFMAKSVEFAKFVQSNVCSLAKRQNKGVKQAGFLVLRETSMPSCLVEVGFISTPDEEQSLNNSATIDNIAKGLYNAFIKYKQKNAGGDTDYVTEHSSDVMQPTPAGNQEEEKPVTKQLAEVRDSSDNQDATSQKQANTEGKSTCDRASRNKNKENDKTTVAEETSGAPVFKIQIFITDRVLKDSDSRFKGEKADYYKDGNMLKYTIGSTTDYNEILRLKKSLGDKFPGSFIVAFKNGEKITTADAIREYRANKR